MNCFLSRQSIREGFAAAALLCCATALVCWPREVSAAVQSGLSLCGNVMIPALFPFFVLTSLTVSLGFAARLGKLFEPIMRPLFHVPGSCAAALTLGLVGGYPVGARTALSLYQNGACSRTECERLLSFCNNSGPAFILGVVGAGIFADSRVGLLLCLTHAIASLCVGLLFRFYRWSGEEEPPCSEISISVERFSTAFTKAVTGALTSILNICAFVVCFSVLLQLLFRSGILPALAKLLGWLLSPLGFTELWAQRLLTGLLELSSGVSSLNGEGSLSGKISMAAFLLGWAGLSVHCQVLSFLGESGLNTKTYLGGKLLQGLFSAAFTTLLCRVFPMDEPVSTYLAEQVSGIASTDFYTALTFSTVSAWLVFLFFFIAAVLESKRNRSFRRQT